MFYTLFFFGLFAFNGLVISVRKVKSNSHWTTGWKPLTMAHLWVPNRPGTHCRWNTWLCHPPSRQAVEKQVASKVPSAFSAIVPTLHLNLYSRYKITAQSQHWYYIIVHYRLLLMASENLMFLHIYTDAALGRQHDHMQTSLNNPRFCGNSCSNVSPYNWKMLPWPETPIALLCSITVR